MLIIEVVDLCYFWSCLFCNLCFTLLCSAGTDELVWSRGKIDKGIGTACRTAIAGGKVAGISSELTVLFFSRVKL